MSKFTLGQRQFPTLGLRSQQPKNYVGPTLSCYLGYTLEGTVLENVDSIKYLSVTITSDLKWNSHIRKCVPRPIELLDS